VVQDVGCLEPEEVKNFGAASAAPHDSESDVPLKVFD